MLRHLLTSRLVSTGATDIAIVALATVAGILVARLLGPQGRGEFAIVMLWPSLIAALGNLGLREAFTYEIARRPENRAVLTGHAILIALAQSVPLMALGWLLLPWLTRSHNADVTQAGLFFLLLIPANLLAGHTLGLLQGNLDIPFFNSVRLSVNLVYLLVLLWLWWIGRVTVWNATGALLLANLVTMTLSVGGVLAKYGVVWKLQRPLSRDLFAYGIRNHAGSLTFLFNQRADQMLMALLLTPVQLGWYTAAVNISGLARLVSTAFATLVFPKVTGQSADQQRHVTCFYSRLNTMATTGAGLALLLTIPALIPLIYGGEYRPSILPALVLTVGTLFVGVGQVWAGSLRGLGKPGEPARAEAISLVVTVIGLTLTLPLWGIMGAAWTSLVAYLIASWYMFVQLRRLLGTGLWSLIRPISPVALRSGIQAERGS
jgi:O-antigen/teichoic acid export membrane protein